MSILIDQNSRIIIQGINGKAGSFFAKRMHDYGNNVVGGIAPITRWRMDAQWQNSLV